MSTFHAGRAASAASCVLVAAAVAACGSSGATPGSGATDVAPAPAAAATSSTHGDSSTAPAPAGYGSLRQEDLSVTVRLPLVLVRAIPLDESIIRLLSPDSYRALRQLRDGQRDAIAHASARLGVQHPSLWYLSYFGLQPDATFSARDVQIVSSGREFRPLELIPLTAGFGSERVGQREVQSAIYLFDQGIDPNQPLTVAVQSVPGSSWSAVIPVIERERALVRSRVP